MLLATYVMKSDRPLELLSNTNVREVCMGIDVLMYELR